MPIYATKCKKCGNETEQILRINEPLPTCRNHKFLGADTDIPENGVYELCGGELERIPAASNFSFRGGSPTPKFYR